MSDQEKELRNIRNKINVLGLKRQAALEAERAAAAEGRANSKKEA